MFLDWVSVFTGFILGSGFTLVLVGFFKQLGDTK